MTLDLDDIAEELAPALFGKELREINREFREAPVRELKPIAKMLHDVYAAANAERYKRMGLVVFPGNAKGRMREPGED